MTPEEFVTKWKAVELKERSAAQSHFNDLCRMLNEPSPTDADPTGEWYCFEKGATKSTGGEGWADVWKRDHFGWEYKGKRKDLNAAFAQLQQYALALEHPPLLVVCDLDRFQIHTNWTNSVSEVHEFALDDLRDAAIREKLKWVFSDPEKLKPGKTRQALTEQAAGEFANLAQRLRDHGHKSEAVAHFINRLVFCMFAEDVELLPNKMFRRMLEHALRRPEEFEALASDLFRAMKAGGRIGFEHVAWFNGGLFDDDNALPLGKEEIVLTLSAANLDWAEIDPSIFGTLFERGLDPDKRSQLGAHYTDRDKIMLIVEPVIIRPWRDEWERTKSVIAEHMASVAAARERRPTKQSEARRVHAAARRAEEAGLRAARSAFQGYLERLRTFRVLDPACGSGNFLYLALLALKDLEHRANIEAEVIGLQRVAPAIGPECVLGIEINPYAAELARVTVWIGEIQWMRRNGFDVSRNPILKPLETIENRDAVLNSGGTEATWPAVDAIIGNPPFLGAKLMKGWLGVDYTDRLRNCFKGRLPGFSDLVCFWLEKAREATLKGKCRRVGLVATSSLRGGTNRVVLDAIAEKLVIYDAWSELPWTIEGARVEVSIVCFAHAADSPELRRLNGAPVAGINADLTTGINLTTAKALTENENISFLGIQTSGPLDISGDFAREMLQMPNNPNGQGNSDVLKPYWNGDDVAGRPRDRWLIDMPVGLSDASASLFQAPYEYLRQTEYTPLRGKPPVSFMNYRRNTPAQNKSWWEPHRPRPAMRRCIEKLTRYIVTPETAQYRLFVWLKYPTLPDKNLIVIVRDDDTTFGILHSRFHEAWALRLGTSLEDRPRYTSTTTFASFPFPQGLTLNIPAATYADNPHASAIADAARRLNELREAWLNPPELVRYEPEVVPGFPDRIVPVSTNAAAILKSRTLTNLYNDRPTWLTNVHRDLDAAVAAAYGWPGDISEDDALAALLQVNAARTGTLEAAQ
jgi:type II restriction/modification system DNA methylase subunit YeeA